MTEYEAPVAEQTADLRVRGHLRPLAGGEVDALAAQLDYRRAAPRGWDGLALLRRRRVVGDDLRAWVRTLERQQRVAIADVAQHFVDRPADRLRSLARVAARVAQFEGASVGGDVERPHRAPGVGLERDRPRVLPVDRRVPRDLHLPRLQ